MFKGVITPIVTVLDKDGKLDFRGNEEVINHLITNGMNGLLFLGSMGEFFALSIQEKKEFIKFAVNTVNKRVPVLIGTGGTNVDEVVELTRFAEANGADGLVVISPYYFKLDDDSLYRYYETVATSTKLPIIIYNFPDRTTVNLSSPLVLKLAADFQNIVGIKDTVDNISHTRNLIQVVKSEIPNFSVLSGFDEYMVPNLMAGGDGVICGLTNIVPKLFSDLYQAYQKSDFQTVTTNQQKISELMNIYNVSQPFVAAIKAAVKIMGRNIHPFVKHPGTTLTDTQLAQVKSILANAEML